jgi:flagellin-like protein
MLGGKMGSKMKTVRKLKAVSPVIATLLLIAIAVAAGIILYVFVSGFTGSLTQTGGQQAAEQLSMEAYDFKTLNALSIFVRNTGTVQVTIDKVYFDGTQVTPTFDPPGSDVDVTVSKKISFTLSSDATRGSSHLIKVVTKTGGTFTFTVIAGRTG